MMTILEKMKETKKRKNSLARIGNGAHLQSFASMTTTGPNSLRGCLRLATAYFAHAAPLSWKLHPTGR